MTAQNARTIDVRATVWSSPAGDASAGGDWCEVIEISDHLVGVTIGDVSGHGEPVAEAMALMRASVARSLRYGSAPSQALQTANAIACAIDGGTIVTAVVAIVDKSSATLTLANAGHPPPLMLTADRHAFLQQSPGHVPLGLFDRSEAGDQLFELEPSALLVFYTDGITEYRRDPIGGEAELLHAARVAFDQPTLNDAYAIARLVLAGGQSTDDAAAIGLRIV